MAQRAVAERLFLVGSVLLLGWLAFLIFRPFFDWIVLGFLFSYLFYRPYQATLKRVGRRGIAGGLILILVLVVFFLPFVLLVVFLFQDLRSFSTALQDTDYEMVLRNALQGGADLLRLNLDPAQIDAGASAMAASLRESVRALVAGLSSNVIPVVAQVLIGVFIFGFTVFYGFIDGPRIIEAVLTLIPLHRPEKELLLHELKTVTDGVFIGHVLVAFIQAALGTIGFLILGVPRTFLWGFIMLIASIIPVIGPFIVWVPVGIFMLFQDEPVRGLFSSDPKVAAFGVLLVVGPIISTIDNIIRPRIIGRRANVHPFIVLIGALGGLVVFGFTGFIVGPLVLSLFLGVLRVYRLHWKGHEIHDERITITEARQRVKTSIARKRPRAKKQPRSA